LLDAVEDEALELDRRAGKAESDDHPLDEATPEDPSDYADERVAQSDESPTDEDAIPERGRS
jgi:hypothetical protein